MQRVPFKNRLSWRQSKRDDIFTHKHTHSAKLHVFRVVIVTRSKKLKITFKTKAKTLADYGEMMDSGARSARRTILIPKCSNEEEEENDEVMQDGDFLFIISKVLTKNNQRRREKTTLSR